MSAASPRLLIATTVASTIEAFLLPYAAHFRALGWKVDAMSRNASASAQCAELFDQTWDVSWSRSPLDPRNLAAAAPLIREIVRREHYDIVHVHTPVAAFVTRYALRQWMTTGTPAVIYTGHGFHFFKGNSPLRNFIFSSLEKTAGRWTDKLIVINQEDYETAKNLNLVPLENLVYMPGIGLDFSYYNKEKISGSDIQKIRAELNLSSDDVLFTMVAEFIPRKRHKDLLEAVSQINDPRLHIAFAGKGPLMDEIRQMAVDRHITQQIHFLGHRKDIPILMEASRATILTSGQEGLARCIMESACLGIPVIGADARGIRDIVLPDRGLLYPVGDTTALADTIRHMMETPYGPVKPDMAWDIHNLTSKHKALYKEVLNK